MANPLYLVNPLLGLAVDLVPSIVGLFAGDKAEAKTATAVTAVTAIAKTVFSTDDPNAIQTAIASDPNLAFQFKMKVMEYESDERQRQHDEFMAELQDIANARSMYVSTQESRHITNGLAYVTVAIFFVTNGLTLWGAGYLMIKGGDFKNMDIALVVANLIGNITGWVNAKTDVVYNFFFGSSKGSESKNASISDALTQAIKTKSPTTTVNNAAPPMRK